jgi:osmotically inducible lipoprotein OsmB
MKNIYRTMMVGAVILSLSACGTSTSDRAISGAGIGAGVGAVGSALTGGNVGGGALVGGAVGAAAGGLTNSNQLNLGRPAWR